MIFRIMLIKICITILIIILRWLITLQEKYGFNEGSFLHSIGLKSLLSHLPRVTVSLVPQGFFKH